MRLAMSGAMRNAMAMLVSGPVGTNHAPSLARTVSMMKPTASVPSTVLVGAGRSAPSNPLSPCTYVAYCGSATIGRTAP